MTLEVGARNADLEDAYNSLMSQAAKRESFSSTLPSTPRDRMCRCRKACGPNTKLGAGLLAGFGITVDAYQAAVGAGVASLIRPDPKLVWCKVLDTLRTRVREELYRRLHRRLSRVAEPADAVQETLLGRVTRIEQQAVGDRAEQLRDEDVSSRRVPDVEETVLQTLARSPLDFAKRSRLLRLLLRTNGVVPRPGFRSELDGQSLFLFSLYRPIRSGKLERATTDDVCPHSRRLAGKSGWLTCVSPAAHRLSYRTKVLISFGRSAGRLRNSAFPLFSP